MDGVVTVTSEVEATTVTWRVYAGDSYEALNRYSKPLLDPRPAGTEFEVSTTVETPPVPTRYVVTVEQTEPGTARPTPPSTPETAAPGDSTPAE